MSATLRTPGAISLRRGKNLATLVAYLLVTKSAYGDAIARAKRREVMDLSAEMRWSQVPPLTFASERVAVSGFLEPAYQVAGDAFEYAVNGDTLHVAVFDAMGHGLAAARLANLAQLSYRNSRRRGMTLEEMYRRLDEVVQSEFGQDFFVTAQLVTVDIPTGRVRWINAGHPRPIVLRSRGTNVQLPSEIVPPIGLGIERVAATETSLEPDDLVLFHSDGVVEARDPAGEEFGRERLADLLVRAAAAGETVPETVRRLAHAVLEHQQGRLDDDATLVLLHWPGATGSSAIAAGVGGD
jgi:serine phosphatase RsbU (regulator of sigma subunit)